MSQQPYGMTEDTRVALEAIAAGYGFTLDRLRAKGKFGRLCAARYECYRFLHQHRKWSTPQIGKLFNRDHTTVCAALDYQGTASKKRARCLARYHSLKAADGARRSA